MAVFVVDACSFVLSLNVHVHRGRQSCPSSRLCWFCSGWMLNYLFSCLVLELECFLH